MIVNCGAELSEVDGVAASAVGVRPPGLEPVTAGVTTLWLTDGELRDRTAAGQAMSIADRIITSRVRGERNYRWPPKAAFISPARGDASFADALVEYLNRTECAPLLGDHETRSNRMVEPAIEEAIFRCDLFIALWSTAYALSRFCNDELSFALQRFQTGQLQLWIFNLDASDVVPLEARNLPQGMTRTPCDLVAMVAELLGPSG